MIAGYLQRSNSHLTVKSDSRLLWFGITSLRCCWLKKIVLLCHLIRSKTNHDSLACIPALRISYMYFAQVLINCLRLL